MTFPEDNTPSAHQTTPPKQICLTPGCGLLESVCLNGVPSGYCGDAHKEYVFILPFWFVEYLQKDVKTWKTRLRILSEGSHQRHCRLLSNLLYQCYRYGADDRRGSRRSRKVQEWSVINELPQHPTKYTDVPFKLGYSFERHGPTTTSVPRSVQSTRS